MSDKTEKQKAFALQYVALHDAAAAYRCSHSVTGVSVRAIAERAATLLKNADVQRFIADYQAKAEQRINVTTDMVVERWWAIATADPNALIRYRHLNCRYCHGLANKYQWVDMDEWATAAAAKIAANALPRSAEGGVGFDKLRAPNDHCAKCYGEGVGDVYIADTLDAASPLYAGVKQTREGIQVLMRDQDAALSNIARWLGMFHDRQPGAANGNPIPPAVIMAAKSAAEAAKIYSKIMAG